jgi:hypothetical protein
MPERAVCIIRRFSRVSKYQKADKLHNEIGPLFAAIFDIFIFIPSPTRESPTVNF